MNQPTPRQRGLYLIAKLYELASGFSDEELALIYEDQAKLSNNSAMLKVIKALANLHSEVESSTPPGSKILIVRKKSNSSAAVVGSAMLKMLDDRRAFPSIANIVEVTGVEAKPKEPRHRYIARVAKLVEGMPVSGRIELFAKVEKIINNASGSFISNWSKLIREM